MLWENYVLSCILVNYQEKFDIILNRNNALFYESGLLWNGLLSSCKDIVCFYNRGSFIFPKLVKSNAQYCVDSSFLNLEDHKFVEDKITKVDILTVNNITITKDDLQHILGSENWLNSTEINFYFQLVIRRCSRKVHVVDCDWFHNSLLYNGTPSHVRWSIQQPESSSLWFSYEEVFMPINVYGNHWILIVIDLLKKKIHYFDSLKNSLDDRLAYQIIRYLYYEWMRYSKQSLCYEDWEFLDYIYHEGFPHQKDCNSCGVYVCATAKAMVCGNVITDPLLKMYRLNCLLRKFIVKDILIWWNLINSGPTVQSDVTNSHFSIFSCAQCRKELILETSNASAVAICSTCNRCKYLRKLKEAQLLKLKSCWS